MNEAALQICQRRSVRRHVRIEGEVVSLTDFSIAARRILDLSEEGMRVELVEESLIETGDRLLASFALPAGETDVWVDIEATVAHVSHGEGRDATFCAGLEFVAIDDMTRALLRNRLAAIPPVVPRRESGTYLRASLLPA